MVASLLAGAAIAAVVSVPMLRDARAATTGAVIVGVVLVVLLVCLALFRRLRVVVTHADVVASFGWGWPRRSIPLAAIRDARAVRNAWYYGWGIRLVPHGWMFNVSGLDAVELELENGRRFRIGTDDPAGLETAIHSAVERRS